MLSVPRNLGKEHSIWKLSLGLDCILPSFRGNVLLHGKHDDFIARLVILLNSAINVMYQMWGGIFFIKAPEDIFLLLCPQRLKMIATKRSKQEFCLYLLLIGFFIYYGEAVIAADYIQQRTMIPNVMFTTMCA